MDPDDPFFDDDGAVPLKHFDVYDFFEDPSDKNLPFDWEWQYAMIETYDYPVTFLCYFLFHTVFQYGYL